MKRVMFLAVLVNLLLALCECSYQYGVYARNLTDEAITVTYKSSADVAAISEQQVVIPSGEQKRIIYTGNIKVPEGCTGTTADHAPLVADYVYATNPNGVRSKLKWTDPTIEFFVEDVQQGTFTMVFDTDDF